MLNHELQVNMPHLLVNLSISLDFSIQGITEHHKRVAALALRLAKAAGIENDELLPVFQSAIIHDIGASNWGDKSGLTEYEVLSPEQHCIKGANLVAGTKTLNTVDTIILCHHDNWFGNNPSGLARNDIPLISRIIHLVDRLDVLIKPGIHILDQRNSILSRLQSDEGTTFDPDLVDLLCEISRTESFWLQLVSPWLDENLTALPLWQPSCININELFDISNLFAGVIDHKSPFTHRHSRGVSVVASLLAKHAGLSEIDVALISIAGLVHDIGKMSVPESILEKPGPLTSSEISWIKQHTYYTYQILHPLSPSTLIPEWAAFHHEKLNGKGYPFGYTAPKLDLPARIMTIADIFSALYEDRPYRAGLKWDEIIKILRLQVEEGYLDANLCSLLIDIHGVIEERWQALQ